MLIVLCIHTGTLRNHRGHSSIFASSFSAPGHLPRLRWDDL